MEMRQEAARELARREERLRERMKNVLVEHVRGDTDLLEVLISMWADAYAEWFVELEPKERIEVLRHNLLGRGKALDSLKEITARRV